MQDAPDPVAILDAVGDLLRDVIAPELEGAIAYKARIAASLLRLAAREWRMADFTSELDDLRALLKRRNGTLQDLNADLAIRLRTGVLSIDDPTIAAHLWRVALAKLAVDRPDYARIFP
jgi:hypothetical protein